MKVLTIGRADYSIFQRGSAEAGRIAAYGEYFEYLFVVVFAEQRRGFSRIKIADNVEVIPTNSRWRSLYTLDAYLIAKRIFQTTNDRGIPKQNKASQLPIITNWIISAQDPFEVGLVGYALKRRFGIPLQLQIHTDFLSPYFWRESLKNKIRVMLARFLLPRADGIRVVSERIKHSLISNLQIPISQIVVLPIFINIEQIRMLTITADLHQKYPQFDFIILMASRLTREKNIEMAIDAAASLIRANKRIGLVIVGDGPEKENLKLLTTHYDLQSNIIFEPAVDFQTLISYYKTTDLFLLTSNYEGYGRTIIEAMAAGCPVVMTDAGVAGEIVRNTENGIIVPMSDIHRLTVSLIKLVNNKELRQKFVQAGYKSIEDKVIKDKANYVSLYCETVLETV